MTPLSPALSYHSLRPCYRLEGKGPGPDGEPWPCTAGVLMPATSQHPTRSTAAPKRRETRGPGWEAKEAARGLGQAGRLTLCLRFSRKEDMGFEVHELWRRKELGPWQGGQRSGGGSWTVGSCSVPGSGPSSVFVHHRRGAQGWFCVI